jgi:hypothetical protein
VSIDGVGAVPATRTDEAKTITIVVPPGTPRGLRNVTVTTPAKISTEPGHLEVIDDQPELLGFSDLEVRPGRTLHLITRLSRSPLDPDGRTMIVAFDGRRVPGQLLLDGDAERVQVTVPRDLVGESVSVTVQSPRAAASLPITVPIAQAPRIVGPPRLAQLAGQLEVELVALTVLGPDGALGSAAVLVNGEPFTTPAVTPLADYTERVVASGSGPASGQLEIVVKDWRGRPSPPYTASLP